jgi:hypothetical protein
MVLFPGVTLFEAAASSAAEPDQGPPEPATPWAMVFHAPPPDEQAFATFVPFPAPERSDAPAGLPAGVMPPAGPPPPETLATEGALPPPPPAPPAEPLPLARLLAGLAGEPPQRPEAPPGAPPPGSGELDFGALLARLLVPEIEAEGPDCDDPPPALPPPLLQPPPIAAEPWDARDWPLL